MATAVHDHLDIDTIDPQLQADFELLSSPLYSFVPRPDQPERFDQQTGFLESTAKVTFGVGGNGSGKTVTAAQKLARLVLWGQPPPRKDTPFLIISDTYEQVMEVCWKEKLKNIIPNDVIDHERTNWYRPNQDWPFIIHLKPWPDRPGKNWSLHFKSYEQGRKKFQARAIGGFWFSEQFTFPLLEECIRGCRETWYDGAHFCEFTPIDPDLSYEIEQRADKPPPGWAFYRLNTDCNTAVDAGWRDSFFGSVSEEMLETRRTGAWASYAGTIYQTFNPSIHVLDDDEWEKACGARYPKFPLNVYHRRAVDWGESQEHPFVCLWGWKDGGGDWFIYDEFVDDRALLYGERIEIIKGRYAWPDDPHYGQTYADPSRPGLLNEFNCNGIPTSAAANDVHKGIESVRRHLRVNAVTRQPKLFIYRPNCPKLIKGLRTYRWLRSSGEGLNPRVAKNEPLKRGDDEVDALRYMIHTDSQYAGLKPSSTSRREVEQKRHGVYRPGARRMAS